MEDNIILETDSYKVSHWKQYPPGTTHVYSYFEARGGLYNRVLFFGLQYILKEYIVGQAVNYEKIDKARAFFKDHFGTDTLFNLEGWYHVMKAHNGRLPIEIKAVPEGTVLPIRNVLFTVENTCPDCFWITSYLETILEQAWYPSTVATKSWELKGAIKKWLNKTGDDIPDFKLHDFGYRGSSSQESAAIGDAAHLINFKGTDTLAGIRLVQGYYGATDMPAFSIPAAEHSTITSWGKDHEKESFENMLDQFPEGLIAVVSDSYDIYNAVEKIWGEQLKNKIVNRKGTLVIRPDSGNPNEVVVKILGLLGDKFGYTTNKKGYKVLPSYLRVIQGDGVDYEALPGILESIAEAGWSIDNVAFGSGGGLLQKVNRDTLGFAYKASNVTVDEEDIPISKNPATDPTKKSKAGKLALLNVDGWKTVVLEGGVTSSRDELQTVFKNGELLIDQNFSDIRKRAEALL